MAAQTHLKLGEVSSESGTNKSLHESPALSTFIVVTPNTCPRGSLRWNQLSFVGLKIFLIDIKMPNICWF